MARGRPPSSQGLLRELGSTSAGPEMAIASMLLDDEGGSVRPIVYLDLRPATFAAREVLVGSEQALVTASVAPLRRCC